MSVNYEKLNVIRDSRGIVFEPLEGDKISDKKKCPRCHERAGGCKGGTIFIKKVGRASR